MRQIDRLIARAIKLKPEYDDIYIISNMSGNWMIGEQVFPDIAAAEQYIDIQTAGRESLVIINDAGPSMKKEVPGCGKDQVKDTDPDGGKADAHPRDEHGHKWGDRPQNSQYRHTWV